MACISHLIPRGHHFVAMHMSPGLEVDWYLNLSPGPMGSITGLILPYTWRYLATDTSNFIKSRVREKCQKISRFWLMFFHPSPIDLPSSTAIPIYS